MAYNLLSKPIRRYIYDQEWESLRPIQVAAINKILTTQNHYIIASHTASGKTEAAFLPILSKVNPKNKGVSVLYISPLIALINDQFQRIEELCSYLDVPVTKWHGEASLTKKKKLIKDPQGVVLITPESIESMLGNRLYEAKHLFSNLKYIIIDEIHSFIGSDRGLHLQSILARLKQINKQPFRVIGLSATLGNYQAAKNFTGLPANTFVLRDKSSKTANVVFKYYKCDGSELSIDLLVDLYKEVRANKALIFPNSRGRVEEIAVKLKKIANKVKGHKNYFSHHSSIDKDVREAVEFFAKRNRKEPFAISCTSTLELGIDIGSVDKIIQVDATNSVSSLIQRLGRSGRKEGEVSQLVLYTTNKWDLLQSVAVWNLYKTGYIDSSQNRILPFDILAYQILSIVKGSSGITLQKLIDSLKENYPFEKIQHKDRLEIIKELVNKELLEFIEGELIIGLRGEPIVNNKDFYSVFQGSLDFKVIYSGSKIGEIPMSLQLKEDENIFLAAKIWKIKTIDINAKKINVIPARDGKKPLFDGLAGDVEEEIRHEMFKILYKNISFPFLDDKSKEQLCELRTDFSYFTPQNFALQRLLLPKKQGIEVYTFTSSRINRTLALILKMFKIDFTLGSINSCFYIKSAPSDFLNLNFENLTENSIDSFITSEVEKSSTIVNTVKWCKLLSTEYQVKVLKEVYYDIPRTLSFIKNTEFILPNP